MSDHDCVGNVDLQFTVQRFEDTNLHYLEVRGACKMCARKLVFRGPMGLNPSHPTVNAGEAVFPFLLDGEEYDGKGVGFTVKLQEPN